ncbi:hypothetical protein V6N13_073208 [Hibiscus sabdariffa]
MVDDPQMSSDSKVFDQDRTHIRLDLENLRKVLEPENLEVAYEMEKDTDEEENRRLIKDHEPLQPVLLHEPRQTNEGCGRDTGERQLNHPVISEEEREKG